MFALSRMVGEGEQRISERARLESLARQGDLQAQWVLDNPPICPPLAAHLWQAFLDLAQTRSANGMAICRLSRAEIRQWEADTRVSLEDWERAAVIAIDAAFCAPEKADDVMETA